VADEQRPVVKACGRQCQRREKLASGWPVTASSDNIGGFGMQGRLGPKSKKGRQQTENQKGANKGLINQKR